MWAMIPMFRVRSSGTDVPARSDRVAVLAVIWLPLEVAEGAVRLRHAVRVLAALDGGADAVAGIEQLGGELVAHAPPIALPCGLDEPAHAEADAPVGADLDRDLVGGA